MKDYTIQVPFDENMEWKLALPIISAGKIKELLGIVRAKTNKRGWQPYGLCEKGIIFYRKFRSEIWVRGEPRNFIFQYALLELTSENVVCINDNDDDITPQPLAIVPELKKFMNPKNNKVLYSNIHPWFSQQFHGVENGKYHTTKVRFQFED